MQENINNPINNQLVINETANPFMQSRHKITLNQ